MNNSRQDKEKTKVKRLVTIHSQKGGVGKTLIALYLARKFAQKGEGGLGLRTVLIDADLTGTSLAEAVPLVSPSFATNDFFTLEETQARFREISQAIKPSQRWPNPSKNRIKFLNDVLFCDPIRYGRFIEKTEGDQDPLFKRRHLLWRVDELRESNTPDFEFGLLRAIPSSGLPRHIAQCIPYVYKETATEFLGRRLTDVVVSLWSGDWDGGTPFDTIIIDTPPVLTGVSHAVMGLRDSLAEHKANSASYPKLDFEIKHTALFLSSADLQDLTALGRRFDEILADKETKANESVPGTGHPSEVLAPTRFLLVLNRIPQTMVELPGFAIKPGESPRVILKDRATILQYYSSGLELMHKASSKEMKRITRRKNSKELPPLLADPKRTFPIQFSEDLATVYVGELQSKKFLYSLTIPQLEDVFNGVVDG